MQPGICRKTWGFRLLGPASLTLANASPALAQGFNPSQILGTVPLAIVLGAGGFAVIAAMVLRSRGKSVNSARIAAEDQVAALRAELDEYEALLSGSPEATVIWRDQNGRPKVMGPVTPIAPNARRPESVLDFASWLNEADAATLASALGALKVEGKGFDFLVRRRDGRLIRASGTVLGASTALRLRAAILPVEPGATGQRDLADVESAKALLGRLREPAFVRDGENVLIFANPAYLELARSLGKVTPVGGLPELLDPGIREKLALAIRQAGSGVTLPITLPGGQVRELVGFAVAGGTAGYFRPDEAGAETAAAEPNFGRIAGVMDALSTPVAIFDARRELVQCNRAYATLWNLDPEWLKPGLDERAILDRLRSDGMLPSEADYHAWRARHLTTYSLTTPRELDPWHLPDGRTIKVLAAPAGPQGGVIYVFEDMTAQLKLKSINRALLDVQRSTLNALSEGVAVFGTNGKLTLHNPRLSFLWKLPMNELGQNPHIDQIAEASARAMPEDGAAIWRDLKRGIIDLNPNRSDTSGRIARADGRLLDYAVVRLPDGQTMMTFLDVTESANYQRVLKERNDALVTADRLKDAFVQNVSYELRSPLTNIIGFADLLASEEVGSLNPRQRAYTDYIRASSVTLGVLIDNILDLATVDAGIAELRVEPHDVRVLVEKAQAGLAASFPEVNGEKSINLVIDLPDDLPQLMADGTRIVQVLYNLLSSAARFTEPGGEVRLSVRAPGQRMVFTVEDEGTATSEQMKAAILESGDSAVGSGRERGVGLGLAIVRTFVNLHGGTIGVERREPRGSRVIVNLPRVATGSEPLEPTAATAAE